MLSLCLFDISVGEGDFVIGLSQISSLFFFFRRNLTQSFDKYNICNPVSIILN